MISRDTKSLVQSCVCLFMYGYTSISDDGESDRVKFKMFSGNFYPCSTPSKALAFSNNAAVKRAPKPVGRDP